MSSSKNIGINQKSKQSRPRREKKEKKSAVQLRGSGVISRSQPRNIRDRNRSNQRGNTLLQNGTAPAAVSMSGSHNISYSSVIVNGQSGLRVTADVPLCQIGSDGEGNALQIINSGGTSSFVTSIGLNPYLLPLTAAWNGTAFVGATSARWISPHIPLLSVAFDRYRMVSMGLNYEPQATATLEDRLTLAWTDDPAHPFLSPLGILNTSTVARTQLDLLVTKDSVAFMPWKPWSLRLPVATDSRFLYDNVAATSLPTNRFSQFGALSCISAVPPTEGTATYGILYIRTCIDLFDPVPITHGGALTANIHAHKLLLRQPQEMKLPLAVDRQDPRSLASDDGDGYELPNLERDPLGPPRFTPLPSTAPGTPHYVIRSSPPDAQNKVPSRK